MKLYARIYLSNCVCKVRDKNIANIGIAIEKI